MSWLKDHEYLAGWLALLLPLIKAVVKNAQSQWGTQDWRDSLLAIVLLLCLGVEFSPFMPKDIRTSAVLPVSICLGIFMVQRPRK